MNLLATIAKITDLFHKENVEFALIGGLALQAQGVTRATTDVEALILIKDREKVRSLMAKAGFEVFFESGEVMTFIDTETKSNRVDFLLAHRPYATTMLKRAEPKKIFREVPIKVARPEDLIGLKVQAYVNDPNRKDQDTADIRSLIRVHGTKLDWALLRDYFSLFNAEADLDRIRREEGFAPQP